MDPRNGLKDFLVPLVKELIFSASIWGCHALSRSRLRLVVEATVTVIFVMLAAILIVAVGPVVGLAVWLLCLGVVLSVARRLRRYVWGQSFPNR
jgi:hypothetical protein